MCGDEILISEECEDQNEISGDGCSSSCEVEWGFNCTKEVPSVCWSICGDGTQVGEEECDDGNQNEEDGCDSKCKLSQIA